MRRTAAVVFAFVLISAASASRAESHPPGVSYPLTPAAIQPEGLAQPLPSTRRYVLVWKDQLTDASQSITQAQKQWIVEHYVGSQKLFRSTIDEYRSMNPGFLLLVYHLAYGLNGADQPNVIHNITGVDHWGQEDLDNFTPWVESNGATRENAYEHGTSTGFVGDRISHSNNFWLMDIDSSEWRSYLFETLLEWQAFPTTGATGVFLDVAYHPWYGYQPSAWWADRAGGSSHEALAAWWNTRAKDHFQAMRAAFAPTAEHPRYLAIPNADSLQDEEPEFLEQTDGAFTENWQGPILEGASGWSTSASRILKYVTGRGKVWIAAITKPGSSLSLDERALLIGTYLLLRNSTSYFMLGLTDLTWYPEYEIDLGGYEDEPSVDLEPLRVAGSGSTAGGLYARRYVAGMVLVNSSDEALTTTLASAMKRATFSGGGAVDGDAVMPSGSLEYETDVPAGPIEVPARSAIILRDPNGPPPPGEEPGGDAGGGPNGAGGHGGAATQPGTGGSGGGPSESGETLADPRAAADDAGCGCRAMRHGSTGATAWMVGAMLAALVSRRRLLGSVAALAALVAVSTACAKGVDDDAGAGAGTLAAGGGAPGSGAGTSGAGSSGIGGFAITGGDSGGAGGMVCTDLRATIRDFRIDHPDFQDYQGSEPYPGIVEDELGQDDKPVYAHAGSTPQSTGPDEFAQWYNDVEAVNVPFTVTLPLSELGPGSYRYESTEFFPIDGVGWDNEGNSHNYHFTTEIHTVFTYRGGETFTFIGDDDLWLFVNRRLAVDLGGLHVPSSGTVDFDAQAEALGIQVGATYPMDVFHAERRTSMSSFTIQTTIDCFSDPPS